MTYLYKYIFASLSIVCLSANAWAGGEAGNGHNFTDTKLIRASRLAQAVVSKFSEDKFKAAIMEEKVRNYITGNLISKEGEYRKNLEVLTPMSTDDTLEKIKRPNGATYQPDELVNPETMEAIFPIARAEKLSEFDLAAVILHAVGHTLVKERKAGVNIYYGLEDEDLLTKAAQVILECADSSMTPLPAAASSADLGEWIKNADPAFAKYLIPGQFPHSEVTKAYDEMAPTRESVVEKFKDRVISQTPDKNGIYKIQELFLDSASAAAYSKAVNEAYGPWSGLKVASSVMGANFSQINLSGPGRETGRVLSREATGEVFIKLYLVADPDAEEKIELIKAEEFKTTEDLVRQIRSVILRQVVQDQREFQIYQSLFGQAPSEQEILARLKELKSGAFVSISELKQASFDEIMATLPQKGAARREALQQRVSAVRERLDQVIQATDGETRTQQVAELKTLIDKLQAELDR